MGIHLDGVLGHSAFQRGVLAVGLAGGFTMGLAVGLDHIRLMRRRWEVMG